MRATHVQAAFVDDSGVHLVEAPFAPLALAFEWSGGVATNFRDHLGSDWRFPRPDKIWSAEELLALVVRHALSAVAGKTLDDGSADLRGAEIAVVVPMSFGDTRRRGLIAAVASTGATILEAIPEEIAVAEHYRIERRDACYFAIARDEDSLAVALVRARGSSLESRYRTAVFGGIRDGAINEPALVATTLEVLRSYWHAKEAAPCIVVLAGVEALSPRATEEFSTRHLPIRSEQPRFAAALGAAKRIARKVDPSETSPSEAPSSAAAWAKRFESLDEPESSLPSGKPALVARTEPAPSPPRVPAAEASPVFDDDVEFTVFRPRVVRPAVWHPLLAFAHKTETPPDASDPREEVQRLAQSLLGPSIEEYKQTAAESRLALPREGELTFALHLPGFECNPPRCSFLWLEPVHRAEFRIRAKPETNGTTVVGGLSVFLGSILLAEVTLRIRVDGSASPAKREPAERASATPFKKIFASYSHDDLAIVTEFERYYGAVGDRYLRDWKDLRAGESWNPRLLAMIEEADVFQLFWSTRSMRSPYVRQEWEHALRLGRPNFVRPCYWEDPLPQDPDLGVPTESLSTIHFHRLELAGTPAVASVSPIRDDGSIRTSSAPAVDSAARSPTRSGWAPSLAASILLVGAALAILAFALNDAARKERERDGETRPSDVTTQASEP